ncbi:dynamin family protein [Diplodia corticola]|uniref:Dynamin family protein n=1 Tax=Diplodia corticola TaxID=236234 RepID=A0A1J9R8T2_9PEZI|nr:dynamin family protein [Diplodia corticola]OJD36578.1 dynamin family protein [Diplodia corticola]
MVTRSSRHGSGVNLVHLPSSGQAESERDGSVVETMSRTVKMEASSQALSQPDNQSRSTTAIPDNIALENLGRGVKELVQAINKIEQLGITKVAGDTPKIVVIGDQSTGKSSVINAISGIQVPRSSGTCTRCPMQITLTENKEVNARWRCDVSLRREFFYEASHITYPPSEKPPPFFPWQENDPPETMHFKTVFNKKDLQRVIKQAQLATLNPGSDPMTFVPLQPSTDIGGGQYQVEFSPNLVCLDISAPGLPNLSFYDLPGVISQTENLGDLSLIKLVKQLVKRYVSKDNALVLLACSMENDIQNSSSAGLLRKYGAIDRCLGILTKPDRLPRGDPVDRWEGILQGNAFQLGHGYHVVRNPSQAELDRGIDHAAARNQETEWFSKMKPWCDRFMPFNDRFGTERLQDKLSQMLAIQILKSLPTIHERVQEQLSKIDDELAHLPEPPTTDALRIVSEIVNNFTDKISKQMEGDYPDNQFRLVWKSLRNQFRSRITAQRPTMLVRTAADVRDAQRRSNSMMPQTQSQTSSFSRPKDIISIDDSDNERAPSVQPTPTKKRKVAPSDSTPSRRGPPGGDEHTKRFDLEYIHKTLDEKSSSDIPGEIDPKALNYLRLKTLEGWEHPTKDFLDGLHTALRTTLNKGLDDTLRAWKTTELSRETARLSENFLEVAFSEQRDHAVPRALRLERHKPVTENAAALEYNEKQELEIFLQARIKARTNIHFDEYDASTGKQTSKTERLKKAKDRDFQHQLGPDPFTREVEAMAKVRGYYNIASMRYVDAVVMGLQAELFEKLRGGLRDELVTVLEIFGENNQDTCARLLAEDPAREVRRRSLRADREKLVAALDCLQELDQKYRQGVPTSGSSSNGTNGSGSSVSGPSRASVQDIDLEMDEA